MHLIFEHVLFNEADESDVEISGFKVHEELQPDVWSEDEEMHNIVRKRLLQVAREFLDTLPFKVMPLDIVLTGSLASYNWSKFSDVDLHIVVDFSEIDDDTDFARDYFSAKQAVWNLKHEILIYGHEIEIYVENSGDKHFALGMYSVLDDEWLKKPVRDSQVEINEDEVRKKAAMVMTQIEHIEDVSQSEPLEAEELADRLKAKIRKMRQEGLDSGGIYSVKNVAFKVLRRNGYLERLSNVKTQSYDRAMSLTDI